MTKKKTLKRLSEKRIPGRYWWNCGGRIMVPMRSTPQFPEPVNLLPYVAVGNFTDLIKVKDLDKVRLPWIIWVGPN